MTTFVDTSGVIALLSTADAHHAEAVATWKSLVESRTRLVTTDLVLAETVMVARSRAGFDLSVSAGDRLLRPPFEIVWVERPLLDAAWSLYRRYSDHVLSLCDCVSFALMRIRRIETAFTYDADFDAVGFSHARSGG